MAPASIALGSHRSDLTSLGVDIGVPIVEDLPFGSTGRSSRLSNMISRFLFVAVAAMTCGGPSHAQGNGCSSVKLGAQKLRGGGEWKGGESDIFKQWEQKVKREHREKAQHDSPDNPFANFSFSETTSDSWVPDSNDEADLFLTPDSKVAETEPDPIIDTTVGIVTLLRDISQEVIDSFVRYHQAVGFDHIFLFFDNPKDETADIVKSWPNVTVYKCDKEFWDTEIQSDPEWSAKWSKFLHKEVMARQVLASSRALQDALKLNLTWLAHIDIDEAILVSNIKHYLYHVPKRFEQVRVLNWEAAVDDIEIGDWFREVKHFKINPLNVPRNVFDNFWPEHQRGKELFMGYSNGKSIVRVRPGVVPAGVHVFGERMGREKGFGEFSTKLEDGRPGVNPAGSLVLLHYINCGFRNWKQKYTILGNFSDFYFDKHEMPTFHRMSRDVIHESTADIVSEKVYRKKIMWKPSEVYTLVQAGIMVIVNHVAHTLEKADMIADMRRVSMDSAGTKLNRKKSQQSRLPNYQPSVEEIERSNSEAREAGVSDID